MTPASEFQVLPLTQLHESTLNPRRHFNAETLKELAASIQAKGVLTPLLVRPNADGFEIAAGHRRVRAAKLAGVTEVPALIRPMTDAEFLEVLTIENLQRDDVHPLEEAAGYRQLLDKAGYDVARIAERVGKSVKYVYDRIKLLALTKEAQRHFLEGQITAGHAILLARLKPADQGRVIGTKPGENGGLFHFENLLWDPDGRGRPEERLKPVSVRELEAYIDEHVKFDAAAADPMLFPETVGAVTAAKEQAEKIVPITHDHYVQPDARDGQRVFGPRSWKRADGSKGAKRCEHAITGVVVVGPQRGEAFKVCTEKQKCTTHWATEQREAKKRATATTRESARSGKSRWQIEEEKRKVEQQRQEAELERWRKATPKLLEAIAGAVTKASARANGLLATIILEQCEADSWHRPKAAPTNVPRGTTAEDLVRYAAFMVLANELAEWFAPRDFPKRAKAFGLDVKKIVDAAAPATVKATEEQKPAKTKAKK